MERAGFLHVREKDVRRVAITCRCGQRFIVEIPQQVARADNMGICEGCQAMFVVRQRPDKTWEIERAEGKVPEATVRAVRASEIASTDPNACPFCNGGGKLAGGRCGNCGGSGKLRTTKQ